MEFPSIIRDSSQVPLAMPPKNEELMDSSGTGKVREQQVNKGRRGNLGEKKIIQEWDLRENLGNGFGHTEQTLELLFYVLHPTKSTDFFPGCFHQLPKSCNGTPLCPGSV